MTKLKKKGWNPFTLLEVVMAIAILSMGILGASSIVSLSKKRMDKAYNSWFKAHLLAEAAEYYLLCGGEKSIPFNYFPYPGYSTQCSVANCADLAKDNVPAVFDNWRLVTYDIKVRDQYGTVIAQIKVDKIVKNEQT